MIKRRFIFVRQPNSMKFGFGHIDAISKLEFGKIVMSSEFTKFNNVKKDDIEDCKLCEFRYACFDCRVFISENENILSKPIKCNYNPIIGEWIS